MLTWTLLGLIAVFAVLFAYGTDPSDDAAEGRDDAMHSIP
jgi:hypothetical protein